MDWSKVDKIDGRIVLFTNAPEELDWGWTRVEADNVARYLRCEPKEQRFRAISFVDTTSLKVQKMRYAASMYLSFRPSEIDELYLLGEWNWTPDDEIRYLYYDKKFSFDEKSDILDRLEDWGESLPDSMSMETVVSDDSQVEVFLRGKGVEESTFRKFIQELHQLFAEG